jgi:hypothetical protein
MAVKITTLFLLAAALQGQTAPPANTLTVSAKQLTRDDVTAMFGPIKHTYGIAKVTVCSTSGTTTSVPLALIFQRAEDLPELADLTVLPNMLAMQVIAQAQGNTKKSKIIRGSIAAVETAAIVAGLSGWSTQAKTVLNDIAIAGPSLIGIFVSATTPASLIAYSSATFQSDPLAVPAFGCVPPALVMAEATKGAIKAKTTIQLHPTTGAGVALATDPAK